MAMFRKLSIFLLFLVSAGLASFISAKEITLHAEHVPLSRDALKWLAAGGEKARYGMGAQLPKFISSPFDSNRRTIDAVIEQQGLFGTNGQQGISVLRRYRPPLRATEVDAGRRESFTACDFYDYSYCDSGEDKSGGEVVDLGEYQRFLLTVNVSFGTPAQYTKLAVDPFNPDFYVARKGAVYKCYSCNSTSEFQSIETDVNEYDPSASSTMADLGNGCFFVDYGLVRGELLSDIVMIGSNNTHSAAMVFGAAKQVDYMVNYLPVDGVIGFGMQRTTNNVSNVVTQLLPILSKPMVTFRIIRSRNYAAKKTAAEITLGGSNSAKCDKAKWSFPINGPRLGFSINTAAYSNASGSWNITSTNIYYVLTFSTVFTSLQVDTRLHSLFMNASDATTISRGGSVTYPVKCAKQKTAPDVVLSDSRVPGAAITLHGSDYIIKLKDGSCQLNVYPYWGNTTCSVNSKTCSEIMPVGLGQDFFNHHCMAYSFGAGQTRIGFTDVIKAK